VKCLLIGYCVLCTCAACVCSCVDIACACCVSVEYTQDLKFEKSEVAENVRDLLYSNYRLESDLAQNVPWLMIPCFQMRGSDCGT
jgi:hypothetical protein